MPRRAKCQVLWSDGQVPSAIEGGVPVRAKCQVPLRAGCAAGGQVPGAVQRGKEGGGMLFEGQMPLRAGCAAERARCHVSVRAGCAAERAKCQVSLRAGCAAMHVQKDMKN